MRQPLLGLLGVIVVSLCSVYAFYAGSLLHEGASRRHSHHPRLFKCDDAPSFTSIWDSYLADLTGAQAAVFTPFHITPGGGEKYLLSVVQALQFAGYHVTVYTYSGNSCRTKEQLLATADALRVQLQRDKLTLSLWRDDAPRVRVFFALGNEKFPQKPNIGLVGFFMCQFPFDLDDLPDGHHQMHTLASYDYVLVNSRFSFRWYNHYIAPTVDYLYREASLMPSIDVLHPPCTILSYNASSPRHNIIMLGRFFDGRQSKGHVHAIQLFSRLVRKLPPTARLILIGQLVLDHDRYLDKLKDMVSNDALIAERVDFVVSAPPEVVARYLQTASVQWHMTGMEVNPEVDPASREHFGISIVECMSAGALPIALFGGPEDIIEHGVNGFLAASPVDIVSHTLFVFSAGAEITTPMREAAAARASNFSYASFQHRFLFYMHRGLLTRPHRHFIAATAGVMRACAPVQAAPASPFAAMIVEPRNHYALEYVILNTMSVLHKSPHPWTLHLYHTHINAALVKRIVASHRGLVHAKLHLLPPSMLDVSNYNQMMKTPELWDSLGGASKVLLFQTDALLVNPGIEPYLQYDYIGAPWHKQNERWDAIVASIPQAVGNGGLSLRTVSVMRGIASRYGNQSKPIEQEDIFYAAHVARNYSLSPRAAAYDFCLEVPCDDLQLKLGGPFAVHAAWYYNPVPIVQELLFQALLSTICIKDCDSKWPP